MTLLITLLAAVAATVCWYCRKDDTLHFGILCWMYWGAGIMWLIDAIFEYAKEGAAYFQPSAADMRNDSFLGFAAVTLGLVIWIVIVLIKDDKKSVRKALKRNK